MTEIRESTQEENLYARCRDLLEEIVRIAHPDGARLAKDVFSIFPPVMEHGIVTFEFANKLRVTLLIEYEPFHKTDQHLRINLKVSFPGSEDTGLLKGLEEDLMVDGSRKNEIDLTPDLLKAKMIHLEDGISSGITAAELRTSFHILDEEECFGLPETLFLDIYFGNDTHLKVSKFPEEVREESACVIELLTRFIKLVSDGAKEKREEVYGRMSNEQMIIAQTNAAFRMVLIRPFQKRHQPDIGLC